jgi:hypothetical protein
MTPDQIFSPDCKGIAKSAKGGFSDEVFPVAAGALYEIQSSSIATVAQVIVIGFIIIDFQLFNKSAF